MQQETQEIASLHHSKERWLSVINNRRFLFYKAKTQMVCARVWLALAACADHIAGAVLIGAEKRAAAVDALFNAGFVRVVRIVRPMRILGDTARRRKLFVVIGPVPIAAPLPDIAGHVIQPIAVLWK